MEELRKFQSSAFDTIARKKLIDHQNTILELSGRVQELQNEVNCMSDSKDFQDAESVRSGNSHVTSRPVSFPPHPIPEGMLRYSFVSSSRKEGSPSIWDTHGISGNVFQIRVHLHQLLILKNCINGIRQSKSRSTCRLVQQQPRQQQKNFPSSTLTQHIPSQSGGAHLLHDSFQHSLERTLHELGLIS